MIWLKLKKFWRASFLNKLETVSEVYYLIKGRLFYRMFFKHFGSGSRLRKPLLVINPEFISIGNSVSIREGARLEVVRSGSSRIPTLTIGDNTNIEQCVHIVCHNRVQIGKNVSITGNCAIVDVTHSYSDLHEDARIGTRIQDEDSFVEIGDDSFVGFGAVILPNVRIGKRVVIGANAVVACDVPDYAVAGGVPATVLKRYDFVLGTWVKTSTRPPTPVSEL